MLNTVTVEIKPGSINWLTLSEQVGCIDLLSQSNKVSDVESDALMSIVNLLDFIRDEAAKALGQDVVFPNLEPGEYSYTQQM